MADLLDRLKDSLADRYSIERELGRGGMAIVYLAEDLKHHRQVAIKMLFPELASAVGPERFLREIEIAARLNHPHILPLLDSGQSDGFLFYVMPYVEGESLRDKLEREKQLALDEALQIAREVGSALGSAHAQGVLHRDIKPANILLHGGHAVVADFGIARAIDVAGGEQVTRTGMAVGTPGYMSPEQATGENEIDARSDIYSLACVLYEMLAGAAPFTGPTPRALIAQHLLEAAPPLSAVREVPAAVEAAVLRGLEKAPEDRFANAAEFVHALADRVVPRRRGSLLQQLRQPALGLPAFVALAIAGGAAGWLALRPEKTDARAPAVQSIAVLPLTNLTGDPQQDPFVTGLTDMLISQLSKISTLDVKSHSSVMRYRDQRPALPEIGRELGAVYLIEGSVASAEDEVRVNIQLIDAARDQHVWSEDYQRSLTDILNLQEEVARAIAAEIWIRLDPQTLEVLAEAEDVDPQAVDAYVKGRIYGRTGTVGIGRESLRTAMSYLRQAIDLAPDWAPPRAELADEYWVMGNRGERASYDSAKAQARAALELDPDESLAHAVLASALLFADLDFAGARAELQRAMDLDPNAHHLAYARYLRAAGQFQDAIASLERVQELEPFKHGLPLELASLYVCDEQPDRAIDLVQGFRELNPRDVGGGYILGGAYLKQGDYERALAEYERLAGFSAYWYPDLGYVNAVMGRTERAREIQRQLEQDTTGRHSTFYPELLVALGEPEAAVRQIEREYEAMTGSGEAYQPGRLFPLLFLRCPLYGLGVDVVEHPVLRNNPRFQDLLSRIGLMD